MGLERTFSIIKPDATRRNLTGKINAKFEDAGLRVVAQKRIHMTKAQAGKFYEVHSERPLQKALEKTLFMVLMLQRLLLLKFLISFLE